MTSLNKKIFNEFTIQELEERLETDPLLLSNLFHLGLSDSGETSAEARGCACNKIQSCPELKCGERGK